ncbi:hypothetical protein [[Clostridium] polysaccharolyticum]|uniref:Uncharacterized protein n=1 Tax=[Clostridium] polysaccharolyticum TaxID=29364 RepID=A0A1I0BUL6_9FIRM|nr:hypothetical protein [[Clostridium] polysaccharolyticum]SET10134.1 hypothetical protein SAMN04487772_10882 [[Clostridium] polysaccharolyticum]
MSVMFFCSFVYVEGQRILSLGGAAAGIAYKCNRMDSVLLGACLPI